MKGEEFVTYAGNVAAKPNAGAAAYRSAISRAYYGAFNVAKDLITLLGHDPPQGQNTHKWTSLALSNCDHPDGKTAGSFLGDLHTSRLDADYKLTKIHVEKQASAIDSVELATEILRLLGRCDTAEASVIAQALTSSGNFAKSRRPILPPRPHARKLAGLLAVEHLGRDAGNVGC